MPTPTPRSRLDRKCITAANAAVAAFPELLAQCEPEAAARIVADLIKGQLERPQSQADSEAALIAVIQEATSATM